MKSAHFLAPGAASLALALCGACGGARNPQMLRVTAGPLSMLRDTATFAGGCFWCMTPPFEKLDGVVSVVAGYAGGTGPNPTYGDYAQKGYVEAVQVTYDPTRISYRELLNVFWHQINPTDAGGQFADRGPEYRSAIFTHNEEQKEQAEESKRELEASGRFDKPIVTEIVAASTFTPAEEDHQDYYRKNPTDYEAYRAGSGRDQFLDKVWGKDRSLADLAIGPGEFPKYTQEQLRKKLTPLQYEVTQEGATETPFHNAYWNNEREGIYVDIVSGEPLFSSKDKFESGTGWPSFTRPLEPGNIVEIPEGGSSSTDAEVRSRHANSHLGDVFDDGPKPTGLRYCMDSAALRFIPREDLKKEGYGQYARLFEH